MKIYELIKKLNTKVSVRYSDVLKTKKYYLSLYRSYMVSMYDKGYISDPTVFNKKEIFKNILDMNIQYLTGVTGKIELSEEYVGFALAKYKGNAEISNFLELLLNVIKYRNISINIDKFHDDYDLSSNLKKKISLNFVQAASRIYTKNGFIVDEGVYNCIYGIGTEVDFISLNEMVYNVALRELGLENLKGVDKSLFVSGLTREEEVKYCDLVLNGLVKLDGDYAKDLVSWLKNNKWAGGNRFSSQNEGLYNWVLYIQSNDTIEEQSKLLNILLDSGKEVIGMKSNGFYVLGGSSEMKYPIGVFSVVSDYDDGTVLPEINRLDGYTGEVYSLEFLKKNDISYVGSPIELYDGINKDIFVDKEQTDMKDSISWFKHVGASITFDESYSCSKKFEEKRIESKLQNAVINAERGVLISSISNEDYKRITDSAKKNVIKSLR